jgi:hypothetical protein
LSAQAEAHIAIYRTTGLIDKYNRGESTMRLRSAAVTTLVAVATIAITISPSHAQSCQSLWVERNSYYKAGGYCFKTPRAIRYFGNAGCRYDDESEVPLSRAVRNRIAQIVRAERNLGCSE